MKNEQDIVAGSKGGLKTIISSTIFNYIVV